MIPRTLTFVCCAVSFAGVLLPSTGGRMPDQTMRASRDTATGQILITEDCKPVLRYNYQTIEPGTLIQSISDANRIYARARSDYIHPLYGLDGEELTKDWPIDHPHHRGIYWAWPEVDYHGERGDLHALQKVFARPTGRCTLRSGRDLAEIDAENLWKWEDREPIVRENARIRAYKQGPHGRFVDLILRFTALNSDVLLARRGTEHYGGLNIRLSAVADQQIAFHTDPADASTHTAWADLSGVFPGGKRHSGLTVFQKRTNPDYPGDWVKFPELNWFQPTFPASGTRYPIAKDRPLTLAFRLWIHPGNMPSEAECSRQWRAYNDSPR